MPAQGGSLSQRNTTAVDLAVVGGGVIGLATAWRARNRGLSTVVLERGRVGGGTSHHAAGMIAPIAEATPAEEPLMELGRRGAQEYEAFTRELASAAGLDDVAYLRCGTLMVARDADEAEALERSYELRRSYGLPVTRLRASDARRLEPGLSTALRLALNVPDDHAIDPRVLCAALAAALTRGGGEIREEAAVTALELADGRVSGVRLADGEQVAARQDWRAPGSGSRPGASGKGTDHAPSRPSRSGIADAGAAHGSLLRGAPG
jgi:glycine oxidase